MNASLRLLVVASLAASQLTASVSFAQGTSSDKAAAEALFLQGKKLMAAGNFAEACPKLAESNRLDEGVGTMLYLAECYERAGMTASAWAQFQEAAAAAARTGDKREKVARERAAKLEPKLARLVVTITAPSPDLEVQRDGKSIPSATWNAEIPVDPGKHVFAAKAPGKKRWESAIDVPASGGLIKVVVPALEPEAPEPAPPVVAAPAQGPTAGEVVALDTAKAGNAQRTWSYVAGGVGIAAFGASIGMGLAAKSKFDDAKKNHCGGGDVCDAEGLEQRKSATGLANAATGVAIAGGALVATGVILFLTAPKHAPAGVGWAPLLGPSEAGVFAVGSF